MTRRAATTPYREEAPGVAAPTRQRRRAMRWTRSEGGPTPDPSVTPGVRSAKSNRYQWTRSSGNTTSRGTCAMRCVHAEETVVGSRVPFDVAGDTIEMTSRVAVAISESAYPSGCRPGAAARARWDRTRCAMCRRRRACERRLAGSVADVLPLMSMTSPGFITTCRSAARADPGHRRIVPARSGRETRSAIRAARRTGAADAGTTVWGPMR